MADLRVVCRSEKTVAGERVITGGGYQGFEESCAVGGVCSCGVANELVLACPPNTRVYQDAEVSVNTCVYAAVRPQSVPMFM